jgi:hypothetical protein
MIFEVRSTTEGEAYTAVRADEFLFLVNVLNMLVQVGFSCVFFYAVFLSAGEHFSIRVVALEVAVEGS